jgi:serine/threonine-protein kinase
MDSNARPLDDGVTLASLIDKVADRFEAAWRAGAQPSLEEFLRGVDGPHRAALQLELEKIDRAYRFSATSPASLTDALGHYGVLEVEQLRQVRDGLQTCFADPKALARELLQRGWLTAYQANLLLSGRGQELVLGQYILLQRLGEGGMGQVFKACHRNLGRIVAIKLIKKERLANPATIKRFEREIRAVAALSHPNIVLAYDADRIGDTHLLVMEYVEGATDLAQLVKKHGPLPAARACEYVRQAALGLQ